MQLAKMYKSRDPRMGHNDSVYFFKMVRVSAAVVVRPFSVYVCCLPPQKSSDPAA